MPFPLPIDWNFPRKPQISSKTQQPFWPNPFQTENPFLSRKGFSFKDLLSVLRPPCLHFAFSSNRQLNNNLDGRWATESSQFLQVKLQASAESLAGSAAQSWFPGCWFYHILRKNQQNYLRAQVSPTTRTAITAWGGGTASCPRLGWVSLEGWREEHTSSKIIWFTSSQPYSPLGKVLPAKDESRKSLSSSCVSHPWARLAACPGRLLPHASPASPPAARTALLTTHLCWGFTGLICIPIFSCQSMSAAKRGL